jgi:hypothetical protein
LFAGLITGCTMAKISGRGTTPLLLNNPAERVELVEHFRVAKRITFDYTGAFDVSEVLTEVMHGKQADAVANLTVSLKSDVGDFFINLFTLGLANSRTLQVEGDLVRRTASGGSEEAGSEVEDLTLLAEARAGEPLMANLTDFMGSPGTSPIVIRTGDGLALVVARR